MCDRLRADKPHWPYIVPDPYHDMFGPKDVLPMLQSDAEPNRPHPILAASQAKRYSTVFTRIGAREIVTPAHMALIKQIDDQFGLLFKLMGDTDLTQHTMMVFTLEHDDYRGDHWLGEQYLFHNPSVKVPQITAAPSTAADATQTTVSDAAVTASGKAAQACDLNREAGMLIGCWDEAELATGQAKRTAFKASL